MLDLKCRQGGGSWIASSFAENGLGAQHSLGERAAGLVPTAQTRKNTGEVLQRSFPRHLRRAVLAAEIE
jgi:hypothetical protein